MLLGGVRAIGLLILWLRSDRVALLQGLVRSQYQLIWAPYAVRLVLPTLPVWLPLVVLVGSIGALPISALPWAVVLVADAFAAALLVAYFRPAIAMPRWLREEIGAGRTRRARPDSWDWLVLWFMVGFCAGPHRGCAAPGIRVP